MEQSYLLFLFLSSAVSCFPPRPTNAQNFVPPFDLVPQALCAHNMNLARVLLMGSVIKGILSPAVRINKCFYNLNEAPSYSPLLEGQQVQLPQPFPTGVIFQTPD